MYSQKVPSHVNGPFIRGPIPLDWLAKASRGGGKGKALHLAILIRHKCGLQNYDRYVKVGTKELRAFGVERHAFYRAARVLESLNLVKVNRVNGRSYVFEILDFFEEKIVSGELSRSEPLI